jgi:5-methylcytosine-specific restriction protein A
MPLRPPTHLPAGYQPAPIRRREQDRQRGSAQARGYDATWQKASKAFLAAHPWCACGCGRSATVVHHVRPHRGDRALFWDAVNWRALAKRCHDAITGRGG